MNLVQTLSGYLARKDRAARRFCEKVLREERVAKLVAVAERLRREWAAHPGAKRVVFEELTRIEKREVAEETARQIAHGLGIEAPRAAGGSSGTRTRGRGRRSPATIH